MKNMIAVVGLNYKTAPIDVLEKLFAGCSREGNFPAVLKAIPGVHEILHLSTCNRVELVVSTDDDLRVLDLLKSFLVRSGALTNNEASCIYVHRDEDAIRHLFRVASSLDSLVMGEAQILGQVKEAYRRALTENSTGIILNRLMHRAFRTAKRVRTETGIAANPVSVSFAAVELAKKIFGSLAGKKTLIIGAGEMAELTCMHLIGNGAEEIIVPTVRLRRPKSLPKNITAGRSGLAPLTKCFAMPILLSALQVPRRMS